GIRDFHVTGVQTCALPIYDRRATVLGSGGQGRLDLIQLYLETNDLLRCQRCAVLYGGGAGYGVAFGGGCDGTALIVSCLLGVLRSEERRVGEERAWPGAGT